MNSEEMRRCDAFTIEHGVPSRTLMERAAGEAVASLVEAKPEPGRVLAVCGGGNNGGDGMIAARMLRERGCDVSVYLPLGRDRLSHELGEIADEAERQGVVFVDGDIAFSGYSVIIDALFGTGLSRRVEGAAAEAIAGINASGAYVFSIDIPSGISADTGAECGCAVNADKTVTFAYPKRGLLLYPGYEAVGKLDVRDIGVELTALSHIPCSAYERADIPYLFPERKRNSNKGDFGKVLIVAGSPGVCGAAYLSALGAYRSGAGIVKIFTHEDNRTILQTLLPEAIVVSYSDGEHIKKKLCRELELADSVVIGPGMGRSESSKRILETVMSEVSSPIVIDADALNIISERADFEYPSVPTVITPHPGEMSRLIGAPVRDIKASPIAVASDYAARNGIVCVLKDARSVICDGERSMINLSGCSAMAKGGSGDVLSGIIGALAALGGDIFDAASAGAYLHGLAGEAAAERYGSRSALAHEIADCIGCVID